MVAEMRIVRAEYAAGMHDDYRCAVVLQTARYRLGLRFGAHVDPTGGRQRGVCGECGPPLKEGNEAGDVRHRVAAVPDGGGQDDLGTANIGAGDRRVRPGVQAVYRRRVHHCAAILQRPFDAVSVGNVTDHVGDGFGQSQRAQRWCDPGR